MTPKTRPQLAPLSAVLLAVASLTVAAAAAAAPGAKAATAVSAASFDAVSLRGFTADSTALVYEGTLRICCVGPGDTEEWTFLVVAGPDGARAEAVFKLTEPEAPELDRPALSATARPEADGAAWLASHPLAAATPLVELSGEVALEGGLVASEVVTRKGLAVKAKLLLRPAAKPPFADAYKLDDVEENHGYPQAGAVQVAWSVDRSRVAVAWNLAWFPGGWEVSSESRAHLIVLARRTLATVDLLDAGAGKKAIAHLKKRLASAGLAPAHVGKATAARTESEVWFEPAFEPEAREIAALAGVPPELVRPLTWKSPWAVTVAAAPSLAR